MKLMSFAEINDLENGQQIGSFQGRITKVFDQKSDVGQYGQWWLQNLIVQDDHANELQVTWSCEDPWDQATVGQTFLFESGRDKKDQLVGIKREIRTKNGKRYESVKVDDRAKIKILSGAEGASRSERPDNVNSDKSAPTQTDPDWPEAPPIAPQSPVARPNGDPVVKEAREHLCQAANLYNLCVKCVDTMVAPNVPQIAQTSEMFQAAVGTLFIEASRAGYVSKMPQKPIS